MTRHPETPSDDLLAIEAVYGDDAAQRAAARAVLGDSRTLASHEAFARRVRAALPTLPVAQGPLSVSADEHEALMRAVTEAHLDLLLEAPEDDDAATLTVPDDLHRSVVAFARDHAPATTDAPPRQFAARAPKRSLVGRPATRRAVAAAATLVALAIVVLVTGRPADPPAIPPAVTAPTVAEHTATPPPEVLQVPEPPPDAPAPAVAERPREPSRSRQPAAPADPEAPAVAQTPALDDHELERLLQDVARNNPAPAGATDLPTLAGHRPATLPGDVLPDDVPGLPTAALLARLPDLRTGGDHEQLLHTTALLLATGSLSPEERARVVEHRAHALEMLGRPAEARALHDAAGARGPDGR